MLIYFILQYSNNYFLFIFRKLRNLTDENDFLVLPFFYFTLGVTITSYNAWYLNYVDNVIYLSWQEVHSNVNIFCFNYNLLDLLHFYCIGKSHINCNIANIKYHLNACCRRFNGFVLKYFLQQHITKMVKKTSGVKKESDNFLQKMNY